MGEVTNTFRPKDLTDSPQKKNVNSMLAKLQPIPPQFENEVHEDFEIKSEEISDDQGENYKLENDENLLHLNIETEEQSAEYLHSCSVCGAGFSQKNQLTEHILYFHQDFVYEKLYNCSHCDYNSTNEGDVTAHMENVHETLIKEEVFED